MTYFSQESGNDQVFVTPFPGPGRKWPISTDGGRFPRWRRDGTEIFYITGTGALMVASVSAIGSDFRVESVRKPFDLGAQLAARYKYDVSPDGPRFLSLSNPAEDQRVTVTLNWTRNLQN